MNVTINWELPNVSPQQRPLAAMRVEVSADAGANFGELATPTVDQPQTASMSDVPAGDWIARLTAIDDAGVEGQPLDTPFAVDFDAPGQAQNVTITVDG